MNKSELTAERLREFLHYDSETGVLTWKVTKSNRAVAGTVAGTNFIGYIALIIDRRRYLAHRLAWLYIHGKWPDKQLDHINGNRSDNRIANLRESTQAENLQNVALRKDSTTGHTGVKFDKRHNTWVARITVNRKEINLGSFDKLEDAVAARTEGKKKYHTFNPQDRPQIN